MFLPRIQPLDFRVLLGPPLSIRFYLKLIIAFATRIVWLVEQSVGMDAAS
jgi:hypothetical protein